MATTYSANARLQKPATSDRQWDVPINANTDALDAMTAIGALAVTTTETPSATLQVQISAGTYIKADGTVGTYGGTAALTVAASTTVYLWLDPTGSLVPGPAFPTTAHLRLAHVITGAATVTAVVDERVQCSTAGSGLGFVSKSGDTISGALTIGTTTASGVVIPVVVVDPVAHLIGFFGSTPATQAPALTPLDASALGGTAADVLADVGGSFSQATLNNNFASLAAKVDALIAALKRHGLMSS